MKKEIKIEKIEEIILNYETKTLINFIQIIHPLLLSNGFNVIYICKLFEKTKEFLFNSILIHEKIIKK